MFGRGLSSDIGGVSEVLSLEKQVDLSEVGSVVFVPLPAFLHEVVDLLRAGGRLGQVDLLAVVVVEVADVLDDFVVHLVGVGLLAGESQDLPHGDGKRPDVALGGEFALQQNKITFKFTVFQLGRTKQLRFFTYYVPPPLNL